MNVTELAAQVQGQVQTARSLSEAALVRLQDAAPLNAEAWCVPDAALVQADAVDRLCSMQKDAGPLAGVPVAVKANIAVEGMPMDCASASLVGYVATATARAAYLLQNAGAVVLCGANMDELAIGTTGANSVHGATGNPKLPGHVPGGSSSGSAALVAAGVVPLALGTDSGGSVRQPAAWCGVVGAVGTWGRISRSGVMAHASSFDRVGVLGRRVADAALAMEVLSGPDSQDASAALRDVPVLLKAASLGVEGLKIGVLRQAQDMADPVVAGAVQSTLEGLRDQGAILKELSLPELNIALPCYQVLAAVEALSNLARIDGMRFGPRGQGESFHQALRHARSAGFGPAVKQRLLFGSYLAEHQQDLVEPSRQFREQLKLSLFMLLGEVDAIVLPTTAGLPLKVGEQDGGMSDALTVLSSLAGVPAISVPVGREPGQAIGAQVLSRIWDERSAFRVAGAIESLTDSALG
ncbi:MAG: aspartyl-tRNA(Asn)/glutamyl-tRNA(Gln) amidotransferase subunit A [Cognaticolwellia sp.]